MRILVCGDRGWTDWPTIEAKLTEIGLALQEDALIDGPLTIIHGDNGVVDPATLRPIRGADKIAGWIASDLGFDVIQFPANWKDHGRAAGPIRNRQMLDEGKPDIVLAFHTNIRASRGTKNMLEQANRRNVPCVLVDRLLHEETAT